MKQYEKCCGAFLFSAAIPAIPLIALLCEKKGWKYCPRGCGWYAGMPVCQYAKGKICEIVVHTFSKIY